MTIKLTPTQAIELERIRNECADVLRQLDGLIGDVDRTKPITDSNADAFWPDRPIGSDS